MNKKIKVNRLLLVATAMLAVLLLGALAVKTTGLVRAQSGSDSTDYRSSASSQSELEVSAPSSSDSSLAEDSSTSSLDESNGTGSESQNDIEDSSEALETEITGQIQSINGNTWMVSGMIVTVNATTVIEDSPTVGSLVEIEGTRQADGSLLATKIQVEDQSGAESSAISPESESGSSSSAGSIDSSSSVEVEHSSVHNDSNSSDGED